MELKTTVVETEATCLTETEVKDKVCRVMHKLATLDDLFSLYSIVHERAALRGDAISGLSFILADCTEELREVVGPIDSE